MRQSGECRAATAKFPGGDHSAMADGTAMGSSPSTSSNTAAPGASSNKGFPVSHELGSGLAASSSSSGPSTPSPSPRSALSSSSACSAGESTAAPWHSLSTAALSADGSLGKRRMSVDADDVRRAAEGSLSFSDDGHNSDAVVAAGLTAPKSPREVPLGGRSTLCGRQQHDEYRGGGRSGEPFLSSRSPPPQPPAPPSTLPLDSASSSSSSPSFSVGHWKRRARQPPHPSTRKNASGNVRDSAAEGSAGGGGGFSASPRGRGESTLTEQPARRLRGATPSPGFSSSSSPPPLDTIMEDHDRFEEISRAEELALAAAATGIQKVKNRQLAILEGIAITHSRLLQGDDGFQLRADVERLLDGARSLLDDLGIEVHERSAPEPKDHEAAGAEEAPPSPLRRQPETRGLVDVAAPSAFEEDKQTPSVPEKDAQALPHQVAAGTQKPHLPGGAEVGGAAGDAMDVPCVP